MADSSAKKAKKETWVFRDTWFEVFDEYRDGPPTKAEQLVLGIYYYCKNGMIPEDVDCEVRGTLRHICKEIDKDMGKWEKTIEGRSKAGRASAEAKSDATNSTNATNATNATNVENLNKSNKPNCNDMLCNDVSCNDSSLHNDGYQPALEEHAESIEEKIDDDDIMWE